MKFLGENKLFEIALKYWGISIREAFECFEEVEYKIDSTRFDYVEELFFYTSKNNEISLFSLRHIIASDSEYFYIRRLDGSYDTFFQDDLLKILGGESQETDKEKEEEKKELELCEDCDCYNCAFYSNGCSPCSECCFHDEAIPFHGCGNFVLDKPFIDYD